MTATAVEQVYRYAGASGLGQRGGRPDLGLATSGGPADRPRLFVGWVEHAPPSARAMLVVSRTAQSRFHVPAAMLEKRMRLADPVVTADSDALRFEAFSACCGVYARFDSTHRRSTATCSPKARPTSTSTRRCARHWPAWPPAGHCT